MTVRPYNSTDKKTKRKKLIIVLSAIAALLVLVLTAFFVMRSLGKRQILSNDTVSIKETVSEAIYYDDNTVSYGGKTYRYNENIAAFLCLGIDREDISENDKSGTGGNADSIFLITLDTDTGKTVVTSIPRDTMTDVDTYSVSGKYLGVKNSQICTAYSYGDGGKTSCEYQTSAVSRFIYGMPIKSYIAIDYNALSALTESVGGVDVVCNETFTTASGNRSYVKGKPFHINGQNAITYLRDRNPDTVESGSLRQNRQTDFLKAFSSAAISKTKKDITTPLRLFNLISKDSVSNFNANKITYLTSELFIKRSGITVEFGSIKGTQSVGKDEHVEFHADEKALFETVLKLFYTEE